jgi:hypothetical protein
MRDNEPLGLYDELRERAERYASQGETARRKIMGAGPAVANGAYAQLVNPFLVTRLRQKHAQPFYRRKHYDVPPAGKRLRAIWPEAKLDLNVVQVVQAVVLESGLTAGELLGPDRNRRLAWPRHVAMWAIDRYCPEYSLPEIAYMFRRDHSTVMHGIDATNVRLADHCPDTKALVAGVRQRLAAAAGK